MKVPGVGMVDVQDTGVERQDSGRSLNTGVWTLEVCETSVEREVWDTGIERDVDREVVDVRGTGTGDWVVCDEGGAV